MKQLDERGSHLILVPLVIAVLLVGGLAAWNVRQHQHKNGPRDSAQHATAAFAQQYGQNCQNRDVSFTSPPLKQNDLGYIRPLGAMLDGHVTPTDHVYVGPAKTNVADNTYPVLMPADGRVVEVGRMPDQYIGDRTGTKLAPEDHRIVMAFNCRYYSIYIHIHKLSDQLAAQVGALKPSENKQLSLDLKAGDTVGYIGGDTFDWTPVDTQTTLKGFISPQLYAGEPWKIHTVSPFDLYTGSLKTQLEAKSWRTASPVGGKIDYDEPGKLIGTWFREGTGGYAGHKDAAGGGGRYWDGHLSIVPDYIDPSYTIVSLGNWQDKSAQFLVKGSANPARIAAADGLVKYELTAFSYTSDDVAADWRGNALAKGIHPIANGPVLGTIAFQVQAGEKLKVEKFPGKTAAQVTDFTAAAQMYER